MSAPRLKGWCKIAEKTKNKNSPKKMTQEEIRQWDDLYQYVKKEIMNYEDEQKLSKHFVLRLKGMAEGKFLANKNIKQQANYGFDVILYTFKACKSKILYAIETKSFQNETAKINYISVIVENNLNDIFIRMSNAKKMKEKTETLNTDILTNDSAEYKNNKSETDDLKVQKFSDIW